MEDHPGVLHDSPLDHHGILPFSCLVKPGIACFISFIFDHLGSNQTCILILLIKVICFFIKQSRSSQDDLGTSNSQWLGRITRPNGVGHWLRGQTLQRDSAREGQASSIGWMCLRRGEEVPPLLLWARKKSCRRSWCWATAVYRSRRQNMASPSRTLPALFAYVPSNPATCRWHW